MHATYDNAAHWYCNEPHNDPYCEVAASILVGIPAWSDSRRALRAADSRDNTSDETMEPSRKKMKM